MRIVVEVLEALGVESAGPPDQAMHFVAFIEKQLGEVRAILACDARD